MSIPEISLTYERLASLGPQWANVGLPTDDALRAIVAWAEPQVPPTDGTFDSVLAAREITEPLHVVRMAMTARENYPRGVSKSVDIERHRALMGAHQACLRLIERLGAGEARAQAVRS